MPNFLDMKNPCGREMRIQECEYNGAGFFTFDNPTGTGQVGIQPMTGNEENRLLSQDNRKNPIGAFFDVVKNCTSGLPIYERKKDEIDWRLVWMDDFTNILFQLRRLTYGDMFTFSIDCPGCGGGYDWEEDLAQRPIVFASDIDANIFRSNGLFQFTLPVSKKQIKYTMPNAFDQLTLFKKRMTNRDMLRTEALRLCIRGFDGHDDYQPPEHVWASLGGFDIRAFEQNMSLHRVGPYTTFEPVCPMCGHEGHVEMPLDGADFLLQPKNVRLRDDNGLLTSLWASQNPSENSSQNSFVSGSLTEEQVLASIQSMSLD